MKRLFLEYRTGALGLIVLILILIGVGIWAISGGQQAPSGPAATSQSQATWSNYSNSQYGFGFSYPASWGKPSLTVQTADNKGSNIQSQTGTYYQVSFPGLRSARVTIDFSSADYTAQTCDNQGNCSSDYGVSSIAVKAALATSQKNFLSYDNDSYASLLYSSGPNKQVVGVSVNRLVNLKKVNSGAVLATYQLVSPASSCDTNSLSVSGSNCATQQDYDNLNKLTKSIKST